MIVQPISFDTALFVAANMRAADVREIFATRGNEDRADFAAEVAHRGPWAWCVGDREPIACIGAVQLWPSVFQAWMFATDRFSSVGFPLTRWVHRSMMADIRGAGARRAHAYSIEGHTEAHEWLERLGAVHRFTDEGYGKGGEAFRLYVWENA